jgi:hypothetical protein
MKPLQKRNILFNRLSSLAELIRKLHYWKLRTRLKSNLFGHNVLISSSETVQEHAIYQEMGLLLKHYSGKSSRRAVN